MRDLLRAARERSVPIVILRTADATATITDASEVIVQATTSTAAPLLRWDAASGIKALNKAGQEAMKTASPAITSGETIAFAEAMVAAERLPAKSVLFALYAHRQLLSSEPGAVAASVQGVANLRNLYKTDFRMLVLVGPGFSVPSELEHDVVVIDDALPSREALASIVETMHTAARLPKPAAAARGAAVEALTGLSAFAAEQVTAMSLTEKGLDLDALWERKRVTIEQTPGLGVWRGKERFADLVGLSALKQHLGNRLKARTPVGVVVWIDEIDKVLANVEHDTSGVRTDQLRTLLAEMENNKWPGVVAVGVGGGGKSAIAKAFANEAGVPNVMLDLGGLESKYVGESESNLRHAMQVIKAIGDGHAYFMATSNAASVMRPELQRRFSDGFWFFDLMSADERKAAWTSYLKSYGLKAQALPDDAGWTGAEIRNCCAYAWDVNCSLLDAARFIVPMSRSRADEIEKLRRHAHGRYLDASKGGPYQYDEAPMASNVRAISIPKNWDSDPAKVQ